MTDNPFKAPPEKAKPKSVSRTGIGCAAGLFLASLPTLFIGTTWALGGSRAHLSHLVVPLGLGMLVLAVTMTTIAVRIWLKS
ncbi:hypothetical protein MFFC18_14870 [Mariniblastus fucicola]|uniref:Uncharacterized protein n=1 Tax=Mariniblastus fucicola TaxID=980251 RepID=A0A5B9P814_9BACT|nr:hypothetical protein MFFC18_14870 [Mariniblastus fucicola]